MNPVVKAWHPVIRILLTAGSNRHYMVYMATTLSAYKTATLSSFHNPILVFAFYIIVTGMQNII